MGSGTRANLQIPIGFAEWLLGNIDDRPGDILVHVIEAGQDTAVANFGRQPIKRETGNEEGETKA